MQKESLAKALNRDLLETKEQITSKLYKSVPQYLLMFTTPVKERDPSLESGQFSDDLIRSTLSESKSLDTISSRVPLVNLNR